MESLERFRQSRSVIEDFTSRTLAAIPSDFGRLYYVSSLKDESTGRYTHEGLMDLYSDNSVQAALAQCHEELFSRILETPLKHQERDLRDCLNRCRRRSVLGRGRIMEGKPVFPDHVPGRLARLSR